jgi:SAM-dependent methyltransferase
MEEAEPVDVRASYDRVVDEYVARIFGELEHKPLDRELLDRFAERVRPLGPACDLGCGPGHVARYLQGRDLPVLGIDLSPGMVEAAARLNPGLEFLQGDMQELPLEEGTLGGIAAFYSIIHIPRPEIVAALREMKRVLRPGGLLLLAFHLGEDLIHLDEWWGRPVAVDFHFFQAEEMAGFLREAGFQEIETIVREPYPEVEHPSRRAYLFAEKTAGAERPEAEDCLTS